jgi:dihydroorotate dehydrogenase (fumarate)
MADLRTNYMGLELKNPIIIGACSMVKDIKILKKLEAAGAAAIVYKSLFEEQIQLEKYQFEEEMSDFNNRNAEMLNLFPNIAHAGPEEHLLHLKQVKESLGIPVIGSLNAIYEESWLEYAELMQETGVDALEINFYFVPDKFDVEVNKIIDDEISILKAITKKVKIPVSVKLSPFYANPLNVISAMDKAGVKGFVLFNRLFQPDIDIEKQEHFVPFNYSHAEDARLPLRFTGLLYGNIKANICSNTGVLEGRDVIKMILAGADAVQVVSSIYKHGPDYISQMLADVEAWMKAKKYNSLADFRGKLSNKNVKDVFIYKRAQYIDLILRSDEIFNRQKQI